MPRNLYARLQDLQCRDGNLLYGSTSDTIRRHPEHMRELAIEPESKLFDLNDVRFAREILEEGAFGRPVVA